MVGDLSRDQDGHKWIKRPERASDVRAGSQEGATPNTATLDLAQGRTATLKGQTTHTRGTASVHTSLLQQAQRTHGNRAVQRVLQAQSPTASTPDASDDELARRIEMASSASAGRAEGGQSLSPATSVQREEAPGNLHILDHVMGNINGAIVNMAMSQTPLVQAIGTALLPSTEVTEALRTSETLRNLTNTIFGEGGSGSGSGSGNGQGAATGGEAQTPGPTPGQAPGNEGGGWGGEIASGASGGASNTPSWDGNLLSGGAAYGGYLSPARADTSVDRPGGAGNSNVSQQQGSDGAGGGLAGYDPGYGGGVGMRIPGYEPGNEPYGPATSGQGGSIPDMAPGSYGGDSAGGGIIDPDFFGGGAKPAGKPSKPISDNSGIIDPASFGGGGGGGLAGGFDPGLFGGESGGFGGAFGDWFGSSGNGVIDPGFFSGGGSVGAQDSGLDTGFLGGGGSGGPSDSPFDDSSGGNMW